MENIQSIKKEIKSNKSVIKNILSYSYDFSTLSKTRNVIYGIAIIFIMFFHSNIIIPKEHEFLIYLKSHGDIGVDIFLFLSGISLIFSYSKDEDTFAFYKRRMKRVLLPTFLVSSIYFSNILYNSKTLNMEIIKQYILNVSTLSFWTKHVLIFWFVSAIIVLYLFYPAIYKYFKRHNYSFNSLIILIIGFCFTWYLAKGNSFEMFFKPIFAYRVPSFLFGCWLGQKVKNKNKIKLIKLVIILIGILLLTYLINMFKSNYTSDQRTLYSLYSVCIVIGMSIVISWFSNKKVLAFFSFLGNYTLEIYLLHEKVLSYFPKSYNIFSFKIDTYRILINIIVVTIAVILSVVFKYMCEKIIKAYKLYIVKFWAA